MVEVGGSPEILLGLNAPFQFVLIPKVIKILSVRKRSSIFRILMERMGEDDHQTAATTTTTGT